jgi:hypothetical protein
VIVSPLAGWKSAVTSGISMLGLNEGRDRGGWNAPRGDWLDPASFAESHH